jgi:hypothetical protein
MKRLVGRNPSNPRDDIKCRCFMCSRNQKIYIICVPFRKGNPISCWFAFVLDICQLNFECVFSYLLVSSSLALCGLQRVNFITSITHAVDKRQLCAHFARCNVCLLKYICSVASCMRVDVAQEIKAVYRQVSIAHRTFA